MNKFYLPDLNIDITLMGGQCFSWHFIDGYYYGAMQERALKVRYENDTLFWQTYPHQDDIDFVDEYFGEAARNYDVDIKQINKDKYILDAINKYDKIILLNQDFEQTLLSFIVSSNNSIKSIRTRIQNLSSRFGENIDVDGYAVNLFPKTEILAEASLDELIDIGLGYRAKYVKQTAEKLVMERETGVGAAGIPMGIGDPEVSEQAMNDYLLSFMGVGQKVADCVHVFGLGHKNLMPIDRWTSRIMTDLYGLSEDTSHRDMRGWIQRNFNGQASLAGQYLFEWYRSKES